MLRWLFNRHQETPEDKFRREVADVRSFYNLLPDTERFSLIAKFQQKLLSLAGDKVSEAYLERNFKSEIDFIETLLQGFDYSSELKNYFKSKERQIFTRLDMLNVSYEERCELLQTFCNKIFEAFQEDYPELQTPPVVISDDEPRALGWVHVDFETIETGNFGPIFIGSRESTLFEDLHTIAHEATHHVMMQFVSLHAREEVDFSETFGDDFERRYKQIERNAFGIQEVSRLYHADPDEYLAFHMGYVTQFLYTANHNLGDIVNAFRVIENMDANIDALARGRKFSSTDQSSSGSSAQNYDPK